MEKKIQPAEPSSSSCVFKDIFSKVRSVAHEIKSAAKDTVALSKEMIKEKA